MQYAVLKGLKPTKTRETVIYIASYFSVVYIEAFYWIVMGLLTTSGCATCGADDDARSTSAFSAIALAFASAFLRAWFSLSRTRRLNLRSPLRLSLRFCDE